MVLVITKAALYWTDLIWKFENFWKFYIVLFCQIEKIHNLVGVFMKKLHKNYSIFRIAHWWLFKTIFPIILQHFYLYSCIWLSTINLSSIISTALVVSGNIPLTSKIGFAGSLINLMRAQNELTNTWVTMTQSWQTNHK